MMTESLNVCIAGSTKHTRLCAAAVAADARFAVTGIITPRPRPVGRHNLLTENPLHQWGVSLPERPPTVLIDSKIDSAIKDTVLRLPRPDILLVVDFGYFVPKWLLEWPKLAPLNIHPSLLPRWRGSSPGQFTLLYGDAMSAVSLMIMTEEFDAGPILNQLPFPVQPTWTSTEFYLHGFDLITAQLPELLTSFATGELLPVSQPADSPTPVAVRLSRDDGFIAWRLLHSLLDGSQASDSCEYGEVGPVVFDAFAESGNIYLTIERAIRALAPWPGMWTLMPTKNGDQRLKLLTAQVTGTKLVLEKVQLAGKTPVRWDQLQSTQRDSQQS